MNTMSSSLLLTTAIGLFFAAAPAGAAPEAVYNFSVAPAHCQAFTPGPSNTIRNRVSGAENIGPSMAVACSFENVGTDSGSFNDSVAIDIYNGTTASISVSCTNLNGFFGSVGVVITKTVTIAPSATGTASFSADDTPDAADVDLGSWYSGVNCTLPTGAIMTGTRVSWQDDFA